MKDGPEMKLKCQSYTKVYSKLNHQATLLLGPF